MDVGDRFNDYDFTERRADDDRLLGDLVAGLGLLVDSNRVESCRGKPDEAEPIEVDYLGATD